VWWLSRVFRRVTFVHSPDVPADIVEEIPADIIVFQGHERSLGHVPQDTQSLAELENRYAGLLGSLPRPDESAAVDGR
jgi:hypothetical protein